MFATCVLMREYVAIGKSNCFSVFRSRDLEEVAAAVDSHRGPDALTIKAFDGTELLDLSEAEARAVKAALGAFSSGHPVERSPLVVGGADAVVDEAHVRGLVSMSGESRQGEWVLGITGSLTESEAKDLALRRGRAIWWPLFRSSEPQHPYGPRRVVITHYVGWTAFGWSANITTDTGIGLSESLANLWPLREMRRA